MDRELLEARPAFSVQVVQGQSCEDMGGLQSCASCVLTFELVSSMHMSVQAHYMSRGRQ